MELLIGIFYFSLSEDYRETIYCSVVRHGGQFEWNYLWNRSLAVRYEDASEYLEILRALTCSTEKWILKRYQKHGTKISRLILYLWIVLGI